MSIYQRRQVHKPSSRHGRVRLHTIRGAAGGVLARRTASTRQGLWGRSWERFVVSNYEGAAMMPTGSEEEFVLFSAAEHIDCLESKLKDVRTIGVDAYTDQL